MKAIDQDVLMHALDWLEETRFWLCTIVQTVGSSPRPVGSLLGITQDGRQVGSVSGGCIEEDLIDKIRAGEYTDEHPQLIEYGVDPEENERLGLPCGGRITLLLQSLNSYDKFWIKEVLQALDDRRCMERHLELGTGTTTLKPVAQFTTLELSDLGLRQCFGPRMRMLLVGAGQLAQSLSELALAMDYEVIVTDPRQALLDQWEGPSVELKQGMPDDVVRELASDSRAIVIALTHDPRIDDMALMEALESDAWYVGALGSKRTTERRLIRLKQLDVPDSQISRLHAPVGLNIGSKTPIEIAIAIVAQLTQLQRASSIL